MFEATTDTSNPSTLGQEQGETPVPLILSAEMIAASHGIGCDKQPI